MTATITRRRALTVAGATAVTAASPLSTQAAPTDPVPALYEAWRKAADETDRLLDRDEECEAASRAEDNACRALKQTPATTPAGAALKFQVALFYGPFEFQEFIEKGDTLSSEIIAAMLRDLQNMGGA